MVSNSGSNRAWTSGGRLACVIAPIIAYGRGLATVLHNLHISRVCVRRGRGSMALKRLTCHTGSSARATERRIWLACVRRVVGVVTLQWLQREQPLKLQRSMQIRMHFYHREHIGKTEKHSRQRLQGTMTQPKFRVAQVGSDRVTFWKNIW